MPIQRTKSVLAIRLRDGDHLDTPNGERTVKQWTMRDQHSIEITWQEGGSLVCDAHASFDKIVDDVLFSDTNSQILGMTGSIAVARNAKYTTAARHEALTYAHMHACQAAMLALRLPRAQYGFRLDDYKHAIRVCIGKIMDGVSLDDALSSLPDWK